PPSGTCFPVGKTTVNCTATDACGNSSSCSFEVTIKAKPKSKAGAAQTSIQYSDALTLQSDVQAVPFVDPAPSGPVQPLSGNVQFYLGPNAVGAPIPVNVSTPDTSGLLHALASLPWPIMQAPSSSAVVSAKFTSSSSF